ncbi:MAG: hypothetical protein M3P89_03310 [Actinomycetota bacterium]|nr:hypothetical protein [Actinomycetota bacterium]
MTPPFRPTPPTLPGPAIAAAVLGLVSATVPVLTVLFLVLMSAGDLDPAGWLSLLVPLGMSALLAAGGILLLLGRSWLALCLPAAALTGVALAGYLLGGAVGPFVQFSILVSLATAVLAALPGVRRWVAACQRLRAALPPVAAS